MQREFVLKNLLFCARIRNDFLLYLTQWNVCSCLLSFPDSNMLPSCLPILCWIFKWDVLAHLEVHYCNLYKASGIKSAVGR